jgi:uncharacterized membrane protein
MDASRGVGMKKQGTLVTGVVVGAGAMYLLDPDRGARRRSLLRDQGVHAGHKIGEGLVATARDARNRTRGTAAALRARFRADEAEGDVLHERVRSAIGRVASHPGAITVIVTGDRVTLTGQVLATEVDGLIRKVRRVRGVAEVRNELEIHRNAARVSALQGSGKRLDLLQDHTSPATRLLLGMIGGLLVIQGVRTRGAKGKVLGAVGSGLLARAAGNLGAHRLMGTGQSRKTIEVEKTISVDAPVEQVWDVWSRFENFPRFMTHLCEVQRLDEDRSHWVAVGPAGVPVEWDAVVTEWVPQQFLGWSSVEGSEIETSGQVRFRPTPSGQTQLDVRLAYTPQAGAAGHAVASLLGADPKRAMDEDLVRFKSLLEEDKTRIREEPVSIEEAVSRKESAPPKKARPPRKRKP